MAERSCELRGHDAAGLRVERIVERPHEVRVVLAGEGGERLIVRLLDTGTAEVDAAAVDAPVEALTEDDDPSGLRRYRLRTAAGVAVQGLAPSWTWNLLTPTRCCAFFFASG